LARRSIFLPTVGEVAERHPGSKLIVDHMGVPSVSKGEAAYRFQPDLLASAKYPNVAVRATPAVGSGCSGAPKGRDLELVMGEALCSWVGLAPSRLSGAIGKGRKI
jgi:hypothetical protein